MTGPRGSNWKGGISPINDRIRVSAAFRKWRAEVFVRDHYTCRLCGAHHKPGVRPILHPHHIADFALFPTLRFVVSNGITLCKPCHIRYHTEARKQTGETYAQLNALLLMINLR